MLIVWDPCCSAVLSLRQAANDTGYMRLRGVRVAREHMPVERSRNTLQHIEYTMHFTAFYG